MKVLFIGGTGVISSACAVAALERGLDLYMLNRGQTDRPVPPGAHVLQADVRDKNQVARALSGHAFDAVVDWIAFEPQHVEADIELLRGRTRQYIFISSASVYQKPPTCFPITESTPLYNPYWRYAQDKIACEERLQRAYVEEGFPITIVRPSHTYDRTKIPVYGYITAFEQMRRGKPAVAFGDGTSLWTLTHHRDFARGFTGLLANYQAIGHAFHITSDEVLTWDQIYELLARAAGVELQLVYLPARDIAAFDPVRGPGLVGDKCHSAVFDNTKIKRLVPDFAATIPFSHGAEEIMDWYAVDPSRRVIDPEVDAVMDRMVAAHEAMMVRSADKS